MKDNEQTGGPSQPRDYRNNTNPVRRQPRLDPGSEKGYKWEHWHIQVRSVVYITVLHLC